MNEVSRDELAHLAAKAWLSEKLVLDTAAEPPSVSKRSGRPKKKICRWQEKLSMPSMRMRSWFRSTVANKFYQRAGSNPNHGLGDGEPGGGHDRGEGDAFFFLLHAPPAYSAFLL